MELKPKHGVDKLLFGMKQADVAALYGKPDKQFKDDDKNVIQVYNTQQWRLTFYEDEDFRLGYIISSSRELRLFDKVIIGTSIGETKTMLAAHGLVKWESEDFDLAENHFNEDNWLILQSEFGLITKVELGAIINENDSFEWKFGK